MMQLLGVYLELPAWVRMIIAVVVLGGGIWMTMFGYQNRQILKEETTVHGDKYAVEARRNIRMRTCRSSSVSASAPSARCCSPCAARATRKSMGISFEFRVSRASGPCRTANTGQTPVIRKQS
ncbi:hypothetical protein BH10PLA1_BH10PLA1_12820 [soil metagenome]